MANTKQSTRNKTNGKRNDVSAYLEILSSHREELRERFNVKGIGIFGSVARGESKRRSDLDVLVEYEITPDLLEFIGLGMFLESLLNRKVDLVRREAIRPELREIILAEVRYSS